MKFHVVIIILVLLALQTGCDLSGTKLEDPNDDDDPDDDGGEDDDCTDQDQDDWCVPEDCNDFDPSAHPGAVENCYDLVDNDCDGQTDQEDSDCPVVEDDDDAY